MPIKFGSPLFSKLQKKYWESPNLQGQPLLFAIQDFSETMSMVSTRSALPTYLYGYEYDWSHDSNGQLNIVPRKIESHRWGNKEISSGFFDLPEAENVSAVVFSNSGTISKFNRMGVTSGFGSSRIRLVREGTAIDHNPNATKPINFQHIVNDSDYTETWVEGLDVYHNPRAKFPINPDTIPGAAHHRLLPDGQMDSLIPEWHPLGSITHTLVPE